MKTPAGELLTRRKLLLTSAGAVALATGSQLLPRRLLGSSTALAAPSEELLALVVDEIIPAQGAMPSASAAGAVGYFRRRAAAEPEFAARLRAALQTLERRCQEGGGFVGASRERRVQVLRELESTSPAAFAELRDTTYENYYTHPEVWRLIGYELRAGPRPTAVLPAFDEGLLTGVRRLPARYRRVAS